MKCLICGDEAVIRAAADEGRAVDCQECGRYEITGEVLALRKEKGYRIDVDKTQIWIHAQYLGGRTNPRIDIKTAKWSSAG